MAGQVMTVLITGFVPFGEGDRNPSQEIARALDGRSIAGNKITGRVLPVSIAAIAGALREVLEQTRPRIVISLGLASGESVIRIERFGVNLADFPLPDNDGKSPVDAPLTQGGADAVATTLPNRAIRDALLADGIPARLSNTAGTYLCNACTYLLGAETQKLAPEALFGFIHLPYLPEQAAQLMAKPGGERPLEQMASMSLDLMVRAVEIAVTVSAQSNVTMLRAVSRS